MDASEAKCSIYLTMSFERLSLIPAFTRRGAGGGGAPPRSGKKKDIGTDLEEVGLGEVAERDWERVGTAEEKRSVPGDWKGR